MQGRTTRRLPRRGEAFQYTPRKSERSKPWSLWILWSFQALQRHPRLHGRHQCCAEGLAFRILFSRQALRERPPPSQHWAAAH